MGKVETSRGSTLIKPYGAAGGIVTGSFYLLETKNSKILIDGGMFQGHNDERSERGERRNLTPLLGVERGLNNIVVTHAHVDHTGRIPKIYKDGFKPNLLATEVTVAFMKPLLLNSAEIQQSKYYSGDKIYEMNDVHTTFRHMRGVKPFKQTQVGQNNSNMTVEFEINGHVEGSSSILIRDPDNHRNTLFTGDMGKPIQSLCGGYLDFVDNYPNDPINTLIIDSTNYEKEPVPFEEKKEKLLNTIRKVWDGGGNPVFPVLSWHRLQEIIEMFHNGQENGNIPMNCEIIIDSPLGMEITDVFRELGPDYLSPRYGNDPNFYKTPESSISRFDLKNLTIIKTHDDSKLNDKKMACCNKKAIILAGGGMADHGRVVNYLKGDFCKNPKNAVIFTCFQVDSTRGANMLYREKQKKDRELENEQLNNKFSKKHKKEKSVGAQVFQIDGFTSHASGPGEVNGYLDRYNLLYLDTIIICHGRESSRQKMAFDFEIKFPKVRIIRPNLYESIWLR
ncbi:MAG: MBL fold metallo-hydrolase [Candidatus Shapirobacteria bacterium]|jgi:metallo-beta-lactamase family protein